MAAAEQWPRPKTPLSPATAGARTEGRSFGSGGGASGFVRTSQTLHGPHGPAMSRNLQPGNQLGCVFSSLRPSKHGRSFQGHILWAVVPWTVLCAHCRGPASGPGPRGAPCPRAAHGSPWRPAALALRKEPERPAAHGSPDGHGRALPCLGWRAPRPCVSVFGI